MKGSKNFFEVVEKANVDVFWNGILSKPLGENKVSLKNNDFDFTQHSRLL